MASRIRKKVNLLVVGYGGRSRGLVSLLLQMPDVKIIAISDEYPDRAEEAAKDVAKVYGRKPAYSTDYTSLLEIKELDAVITPSSWTSHSQVCLDAMNAGLYAATEVGGATSIEQCWDLVHTSEKTGMPCMLLENCCYGREEMTVLNMISKGLFGELVHAEGGYRHDLRSEVGMGHVNRHYRLDNYLNRNGDVYPTHDLGPIAKYLKLNRGNRMLTLCSTASKSCGIEAWIKKNRPRDKELAGLDFALGDVVVTNIKCAHGETITLFHDTSLPRPYSRGNLLQGTKGIWSEDKHGVYLDGITKHDNWAGSWDDMSKIFKKYEHPLWKKFMDEGVKGGHGGMDYLVLRGFIEAVKNRTQTPIDVYDTASWMAITPLTEDSVAMGGHPVPIPDFTNGRWINRKPVPDSTYCLEQICEPGDL